MNIENINIINQMKYSGTKERKQETNRDSPEIMLADEPTGNLRYKNTLNVIELMYINNDIGTTFLIES